MRRSAAAVVLVVGALVIAAGRTGERARTRSSPTKLTVWVGWSAGHELTSFKKVVAEYDKKHPEVTINVVGGIDDNKIVAAIRSGTAPDVVSSFNSYNVGNYCGSGGWIDLGAADEEDHIDASMFPPAPRYYTQYEGKRCALPLLADDYGLYYNKKLFKAAGITRPPHTTSELAADAKKLTVRDKSGKIKVAGFDPVDRLLREHARPLDPAVRRQVGRRKGHSLIGTDPAWAKWATWQKSLVDWYGYNKLVRFQAQPMRRVHAVAGVRDRQARDELRRRVARRVHPQRASEPRLRHGADARRRCASRALRLGLHQRHDHRHPARRPSTRTRRGRSSST